MYDVCVCVCVCVCACRYSPCVYWSRIRTTSPRTHVRPLSLLFCPLSSYSRSRSLRAICAASLSTPPPANIWFLHAQRAKFAEAKSAYLICLEAFAAARKWEKSEQVTRVSCVLSVLCHIVLAVCCLSPFAVCRCVVSLRFRAPRFVFARVQGAV